MPTSDKNAVFDNWTEYQIRILFEGWNTKNIWQFALSCGGIFCLCMTLQFFDLLKDYVKTKIYLKYKHQNEERIELIKEMNGENKSYDSCPNCTKFGYYLVSLLYYLNFLFVILCVTTFNPWVFFSIGLGYATGELIVFRKRMSLDFDKYS
jgi:hypothetical protein